jgi:hypothetical protein
MYIASHWSFQRISKKFWWHVVASSRLLRAIVDASAIAAEERQRRNSRWRHIFDPPSRYGD